MEFTLEASFNVSQETIYNAWLNSEKHSAMTGSEANCSDQLNGEFTAWGGYIWGKNLSLSPTTKIVQSWRTSEFLEDEEDSKIEVILKEVAEGTKLTLVHSNLPEHGEQYINGWKEHYFAPMAEYFG